MEICETPLLPIEKKTTSPPPLALPALCQRLRRVLSSSGERGWSRRCGSYASCSLVRHAEGGRGATPLASPPVCC